MCYYRKKVLTIIHSITLSDDVERMRSKVSHLVGLPGEEQIAWMREKTREENDLVEAANEYQTEFIESLAGMGHCMYH